MTRCDVRKSFTRIALALFLLGSTSACTSIYQKRGTEPRIKAVSLDAVTGTSDENRLHQINLEGRSIEDFDGFSIGVVELDDNGNANPAQRAAVLKLVRDTMAASDTLLVNFVHGWHHGAEVCDRDLACFRRVMARLVAMNRDRKVIGVFIGWRGESSGISKLNNVTIWNRKRAAQHIGRTGARELLFSLQELYQDARSRKQGPGKKTTMVTVGHSLGGAMLFEAVRGKLTGRVGAIERPGKRGERLIVRAVEDRLNPNQPGRKALRAGFGDLVVLVNPALEAREYEPFNADIPRAANANLSPTELVSRGLPRDANLPFADDQLPVMITIASEADTAMGLIFPAAQWIQSLARFRPWLLHPSGWHGIGRYEPHVTHTLTYPLEKRSPISKEPVSVDCDCTKEVEARVETYDESQVKRGTEPFLDIHTRETKYPMGMTYSLVPERQSDWDVHSPYLVIRANAGVISEHSDIFNPMFVGFLLRYIKAIENERAAAPVQKR